jgi:hypothetical protein
MGLYNWIHSHFHRLQLMKALFSVTGNPVS